MSTLFHTEFEVSCEADGQRLDVFLAAQMPELSRSRLAAWIKTGDITLDAAVAKPSTKVWSGARVRVAAQAEPENDDAPEERALDVVFDDAHIVVINKPPGLVVHPGAGNRDGTLLNALLHFAPQVREVPRAGIVHRLDKDTSGLMVVAKTLAAQTALVRQLQARSVHREYVALVHGIVDGAQTIEGDIGRHPTQRTKMAVVKYNGKEARTHVKPQQYFDAHTLVVCKLDTGRTHQIRVHLSEIGHPLVGDSTYGKRKSRPPFHRQALHAQALGLVHPQTGKALRFKAPMPEDFAALLGALEG